MYFRYTLSLKWYRFWKCNFVKVYTSLPKKLESRIFTKWIGLSDFKCYWNLEMQLNFPDKWRNLLIEFCCTYHRKLKVFWVICYRLKWKILNVWTLSKGSKPHLVMSPFYIEIEDSVIAQIQHQSFNILNTWAKSIPWSIWQL